METVIRTHELTYRYNREAMTLDKIDLLVQRGDIYGFLGPNGSGKTTTLSLLLGLLKIQQGTVEILGMELPEYRTTALKKVGSLIESPSLYGHLTAQENLEVYREIYGASRERIKEVLAIVDLQRSGKKQARNFSLGMKQRLALALALLPRPELIILDEPTNGLDPAGILELRHLIRNINQKDGVTFLISSHILHEVEKVANRIGIIFQGSMRFQGTLEELNTFAQKTSRLELRTSDDHRAASLLRDFNPETHADHFVVSFRDMDHVASINRLMVDGGIDVYSLHPQKQDLEKLFMNLTENP